MLDLYYKTFVSLGNTKQNFSRLLNMIESQLDFLPNPVLVQCGHTPFSSTKCKVIEFVNMDFFVRQINHAEILMLHAGAGSVLHAIKSGKYPIIMPRRAKFGEHVNDHQVGFAKALHALGKAIMVEDTKNLEQAIITVRQNKLSLKPKNNFRVYEVVKNLLPILLKDKQ